MKHTTNSQVNVGEWGGGEGWRRWYVVSCFILRFLYPSASEQNKWSIIMWSSWECNMLNRIQVIYVIQFWLENSRAVVATYRIAIKTRWYVAGLNACLEKKNKLKKEKSLSTFMHHHLLNYIDQRDYQSPSHWWWPWHDVDLLPWPGKDCPLWESLQGKARSQWHGNLKPSVADWRSQGNHHNRTYKNGKPIWPLEYIPYEKLPHKVAKLKRVTEVAKLKRVTDERKTSPKLQVWHVG